MASVNPHTRELVFKLVFYGPGLGGKTTTLQYIYAATNTEHRGKMVSLATPTDRTLYFDFLPVRVPRVRGLAVKLQLFTVPGQVYYAATRKLVLSGADGVVFVADSQAGRLDTNQESLDDLQDNLAEHNRSLDEVPHTFHWNKRDLGDLVSIEELDRRFNPRGVPSLGTVATRGEGVFEGLERITRLVLKAYEKEPKVRIEPEGGTPTPGVGAQGALGKNPQADEVAVALRGMETPGAVAAGSGAASVVGSDPPPVAVRTQSRAAAHDTEMAGPLRGGASSNGPAANGTSGAAPANGSRASAPSGSGSVQGSGVEAPTKISAVVPELGRDLVSSSASSASAASASVTSSASSEPRPPGAFTRFSLPDSQAIAMEGSAPAPAPRSAGSAPVQPTTHTTEASALAQASLPSFTLSDLWPEGDRDSVRQAESMFAARDAVNAILACDVLVTRTLASAAGLVGTLDAPRDPAVVSMLLGLDGRRYLQFRTLVRAARHREAVTMRDAIECFTFTLEARRAREALRR